MPTNTLNELTGRYRVPQDQIRELGFIAAGSLIERYTKCGAQRCRCAADPPQRHGPYFQYTRKIGGKTVTARLTAAQAEYYRVWIANRRRLEELIDTMEQISDQARQLLLNQLTATQHQK